MELEAFGACFASASSQMLHFLALRQQFNLK